VLNFVQSKWKTIGMLILCTLSLAFVVTSYVIGQQVQDVVSSAKKYGSGDNVTTSLLAVVNNAKAPLSDRNSAIWALGQLGNSQALKTLEALYSGAECNHDQYLCQHELHKAIKLCGGEMNIGALVWRHGALAMR